MKLKRLLVIAILLIVGTLITFTFILTIEKPLGHLTIQNLFNIEVDKEKVLAKVRTDANILMFGDMIFEEPLFTQVKKGESPFKNMVDEFSKYDLVVGNLETTIDGKSVGKAQSKPYTFSAPKNLPSILKEAGIDIVGYANNHTKDYGPSSVTHTIELLNKAKIRSFGAGKNSNEAFKTLVVNVNGNKIGFFGINSAEYLYNISGGSEPGTAFFNEALTTNAIREGAKRCDVLIVFAHWGDERSSRANAFQKLWAKKFIDLGADIVVGSHPHVRQEIEDYNGKKIYYSLGNFIFPGVGYAESRIGYILNIKVDKKKVVKTSVKNIQIDMGGIPRIKK